MDANLQAFYEKVYIAFIDRDAGSMTVGNEVARWILWTNCIWCPIEKGTQTDHYGLKSHFRAFTQCRYTLL